MDVIGVVGLTVQPGRVPDCLIDEIDPGISHALQSLVRLKGPFSCKTYNLLRTHQLISVSLACCTRLA